MEEDNNNNNNNIVSFFAKRLFNKMKIIHYKIDKLNLIRSLIKIFIFFYSIIPTHSINKEKANSGYLI